MVKNSSPLSQLSAFLSQVLPPLALRYAKPLMRTAGNVPAVRAVMLFVVGFVLFCIVVPPAFIGLVVYLSTGDPGAATSSGLVVLGLMIAVMGSIVVWLRGRWTKFRRRHGG